MTSFIDRVQDSTLSIGTGSITLANAPPTGKQAFVFTGSFSNGDTPYYCIQSPGGSEWEVGLGTLSGGTTLARTTVLASSNAGALVNFSAGSKDVFATIPASVMAFIVASTVGPIASPGGRLTLTTLTPVMTADVTAGTTVYYTPYVNSFIRLFDGANWNTVNFSQVSQALSDTTKSPAAAAASSAYDVFGWSDAGTFRATRGYPWTTASGASAARGTGAGTTELVMVNGVLMNANAITNGPAAQRGVYLGSFITNASSQVVWIANPAAAAGGGNAQLSLWNMYNRRLVQGSSYESTTGWTYATNTFRAANASNSNRVTVFMGLNEDALEATANTSFSYNGSSATFGHAIGVDSITTPSGTQSGSKITFGWNAALSLTASWSGQVGLGGHFLQILEASSSGVTHPAGTAPYQMPFAISVQVMM